ncbi:MAG: L-threonylcarbamoyladenylate synthase [Gemmatimonadales bacterium]|nr:L-threonylcarbamoyladenylate synthase [Gemmatimonadales bacterium]
MTRVLEVPPDATPAHPAIVEAARVLRAGGLVAFPTETVYGLGANALDAAAVRAIFAAKGRPSSNPVIAHVPDVAAARRLVRAWPAAAQQLATAYWPGPLTLVLPKAADVPAVLTAGQGAVAVRCPSHPVALALLRAAGVPIAAPSANPSTQLSPTLARHVVEHLRGRVDLVLDGGPTSVGIESTVVDLSGDRPRLLRPGSIARPALERLLGPLADPDADAPALSPGMAALHYAPRAALRLVAEGGALEDVLCAEASEGRLLGVIARRKVHAPDVLAVRLPDDAAGYARDLYAALHALDAEGVALILVEEVPPDAEWEGVRDRIGRAARG